MKKIAIVACLQANEVCAGCGCLNAFQDRTQNFERYVGEEVRLAAFMRCSHCIRKEGDPLADAGFVEKLERCCPEVRYVNRWMTHSWGQTVVRFYDPDGNLIEVGTPV